MKKALIHEWFTDYAGSERCVESFINIWNDLDVYSLVDFLTEVERQKILKGKFARTSFIQTLPFSKKHHRLYLPLFPLAVEQFDLSSYKVIISSSHSAAKGVLTNYDQLHICYCHTPIRYAWDLYHQYLEEAKLARGLKSILVKYFLHRIRIWDVVSANRVDHFVANSNHVAGRIKKIYNRDAHVIYPPVDINKFETASQKENFYVTASRFVPYKRVDLIVEAFSAMPDRKLLVIGDGPEMKKIKSKALSNVELLGYLPSHTLKDYLSKAKAFVFAAQEDFGIIVVEAMASGTPVIALNKGGTAETVIDNFNGIHFSNQRVDDIIQAVKKFESNENKFDQSAIRESTEKYSRENFEREFEEYVNKKTEEFSGTKRLRHK